VTTAYPFRSALVTGASSGIGAAMTALLGDAGVPVVVVARRRERLDELARSHPAVEVLAADLSTQQGCESVAERLADDDRPIDLLVNNAGFGSSGDFVTLDADRLDDEIGVNVRALTYLSRAVLPGMIERRRGWLLNVSSIAGFQSAPGLAVYAATKAYVTSLSESLHEELRATGVRVTALCPGLTRTEFQSVSGTDLEAGRFPLMTWLTAEDVARTGLADCAKGRALSVPGPLYKGLAMTSQLLPRDVVRRVVGLTRARSR
jgi:uncharacterized protein